MLRALRRFYSEVLFPWGMDKSMSSPIHTEARRNLLRETGGKVVEIGFGTGLNLPQYPDTVEKIWTADPNPGHGSRAQKRIEASAIPVDHQRLHGERLPFDDNFFDFAVSTWTLCSINDLPQALSEIQRVLKPEGRFLFLEHGISPDSQVAKWQNRLNGLQMIYGDGCRLNRNFRELIPASGFRIDTLDEFYQEKQKKYVGYTYRGSATPLSA
jgi:ubiquinone/menaquinone biosynthesis C-methylase UbiE